MILVRKKGQLSLEFILLILGVILAGAFVTLQLVEKSPKFLGNESSEIKKGSMGLFVSEANFSPNIRNTIISPILENNTINETENVNKPPVAKFTYKILKIEDYLKCNIKLNANICPTSSGKNNALKIYDTSGKIYSLYKQGSKKGLIDQNGNKVYINSGNSFSGTASKIIFKAKGNPKLNTLIINGTPVTIPNGYKKFILKGDFKYTITHERHGAGQFNIEVEGVGIVIVEKGNSGKFEIIYSSQNGNIIKTYPVKFDASASYDPDGEIVKYLWDFGDGITQETANSSIYHIYESNGTYLVKLTVIDNKGATNSTSEFIEVSSLNYTEENDDSETYQNTTQENISIPSYGIGENLYFDISGDGEVDLDSEINDDAKWVHGNISLTTNDSDDSEYEYNANGTVYGDVYVTGNASYELGNLKKINNLQTYLTGSAELEVNVPEISKFVIRDKESGISEIGSGVKLEVENSDIGQFYVEKITGGAKIKFEDFTIDTFETNSSNFGEGAETTFENGKITKMNFGDIVGGGKPEFKNMIIGDIVINNMRGGPEINFENTTINSIKMNKLTENPKLIFEDSSSLNSLEADQLSGSDIEVKDGSIIKEIIIHGSTGDNGKIYVGDGGKIEKLFVNGSVNAEMDIKEFSGLIDISVGDITSSGKLYVDNVTGGSISTGIVENGNGLQIEDSRLSFVDIEGISKSGTAFIENTYAYQLKTGIVENDKGLQIETSNFSFVEVKGVSNSGSASIKNTHIYQLNIDSLPDWGSDITLNEVNITKLSINEIGNGTLIIKNSKIDELHIIKISGGGKITIEKSYIGGKYYKKLEINKNNYKEWS